MSPMPFNRANPVDEERRPDSQPLLEDEGSFNPGSIATPQEEKLQRRKVNEVNKWLLYALILAYLPLLTLYLILHFKEPAPAQCADSRLDVFPSLAQSNAIQFERRPLAVKLRNNPFSGPPRPELDAAWHELFEKIRIRVSREDLEYYNLTSVPMADGSGYAAELGVHHELHCLKKIRHWIYKDYYLVNETEAEMVEWRAHIDHCMEMMRLSIMCRGSPSLSTFHYLSGDPAYLTAVALGHHQCVNWDRLLEWVRERAVPIFEPGVLAGPESVERDPGM